MKLTAALQKLDQLQRKQLAYSHAMGLKRWASWLRRYTSCPQARKL